MGESAGARIARAALAGLVLVAATSAWAADAFVAGLEDVPLMPRLVEDAGQRLKFDSPGGRVIETLASGEVARGDVLEFYTRTLPELGWRPVSDGVWTREGERLRIEFPAVQRGAAPGHTLVRFYLAPG